MKRQKLLLAMVKVEVVVRVASAALVVAVDEAVDVVAASPVVEHVVYVLHSPLSLVPAKLFTRLLKRLVML